MGAKIYNIDFSNSPAPSYLLPAKVVRALDRPEACDNLICFVGECAHFCSDETKDCIYESFEATIRPSEDICIEDYGELCGDAYSMFFTSHSPSYYWFNIPSLCYLEGKGPDLSWKLAAFLKKICGESKHFLVCIKQSRKSRPIILTNCDLRTFTPNTPAHPAPQPETLKWLTDEQCEILTLRLELLKRDFQYWCNYECVTPPKELFGNSLDFIKMCHSKKLLDGASSILEYNRLRALRLDILSLQGLGLLCNSASNAEKILNPLKPYLDAVYDLPAPATEFKATIKVEVNEGDSNNE
jgi:hypothetical protein